MQVHTLPTKSQQVKSVSYDYDPFFVHDYSLCDTSYPQCVPIDSFLLNVDPLLANDYTQDLAADPYCVLVDPLYGNEYREW